MKKASSWPKSHPCCSDGRYSPYNSTEVSCFVPFSLPWYKLIWHHTDDTQTHTNTGRIRVVTQQNQKPTVTIAQRLVTDEADEAFPPGAALIYSPASVKIPAGIVSPRCRCKCKPGWEFRESRERRMGRPTKAEKEREGEMREQIRLVLGACLWFLRADVSPGSWGCWQHSRGKGLVDVIWSYFDFFYDVGIFVFCP